MMANSGTNSSVEEKEMKMRPALTSTLEVVI
jgi:hypothetical protein